MRRGGTWRTTQETAWSLIALDDYRHAQEKEAPDFEAKVMLERRGPLRRAVPRENGPCRSTSLSAERLFEAHAGGSALGFEIDG